MTAPPRRDVASRVHSAALHLLRVARTVDGESGLTAARLSALSVLVFGGPRTIGGLAEAEGVRSPTMTSLVNQLEAEGLVRRTAAPEDQRRVVVRPTAAGTRRMRVAQARRVDLLVSVLDGVTREELETLDAAASIIDRSIRRHLAPATGEVTTPG